LAQPALRFPEQGHRPTSIKDYFWRQRVKRFELIPIFGALGVEKDEFYRSATLETSCPRRLKREEVL
jgi:hypothetical protein